MSSIRTLALIAALSVPATAMAKTTYEPTATEAFLGSAPSPKGPWVDTTGGALQGKHLNIYGSAVDSFGSNWWGGGYNASYQIWDWTSGTNNLMLGGITLRTNAKLFFTNKEVARIRVGAHNWGSNVTNGSVIVNGKTIKNWYLTDAALKETYQKTTSFFNKTKSFGIGPFSVNVNAKSSGLVKLEPNVEMKNLRMTLSATPSTRVNVSTHVNLDAWVVSAKVVGSLAPLIEAKMPATSYLQIKPGQTPCWNTEVSLDLTTTKGKIVVTLDYFFDKWISTIAD